MALRFNVKDGEMTHTEIRTRKIGDHFRTVHKANKLISFSTKFCSKNFRAIVSKLLLSCDSSNGFIIKINGSQCLNKNEKRKQL